MTQLEKCPECGEASLARHCPETNKVCRWVKCRRKDCEAVLDMPNLRGFKPGGESGWLPINLAGGGPR